MILGEEDAAAIESVWQSVWPISPLASGLFLYSKIAQEAIIVDHKMSNLKRHIVLTQLQLGVTKPPPATLCHPAQNYGIVM